MSTGMKVQCSIATTAATSFTGISVPSVVSEQRWDVWGGTLSKIT
jgi:hypothetical protein